VAIVVLRTISSDLLFKGHWSFFSSSAYGRHRGEKCRLDAFALNVMSTDSWSSNALKYLFAAAQQQKFKLFFSFDMTHFSSPATFIPTLQKYMANSAYYKYKNRAFLSTFNGGQMTFGSRTSNAGWNKYLTQSLSTLGLKVFFVPNFSDSTVAPAKFFDQFADIDGVMGWDSAWPPAQSQYAKVSSAVDEAYMSSAKKNGKVYMMRRNYFPVSRL
jgi:glucan endo-1,3-alpha-glucosidase